MNGHLEDSSRRQQRWMSWVYGGILLGLLNTFAIATYGALGVSRNYAVADGWLSGLLGLDFASTNSYMSGIPSAIDWLFMVSVGMVIGGFLATVIKGKLNVRSVPRLWARRFGDSKPRRFAAAFAGGFLLLFGARLAGGCTSGLVLSGIAQLALAGFIFAIAIMASGIVTARFLYRRQSS